MTITSIIQAYPLPSVMTISVIITFCSMLVTKFLTDQNRMKELKDVQKACQIKLKDNKGKPEKTMEIQKQMMECSMEMMKMSFKPMLITFIPLLIVFGFVRSSFAATSIAGSWIWYYIGTSIISSLIIRKILKM